MFQYMFLEFRDDYEVFLEDGCLQLMENWLKGKDKELKKQALHWKQALFKVPKSIYED